MAKFLRSAGTSGILGLAVFTFAIEVLAPRLPPYAGPPDLRLTRSLTLPSADTLHIDNSDGSIRVLALPGTSEITVEVRIKVYALSPAADMAAMQRYSESLIQAQSSAGILRLTTEPLERPETLALQVEYIVQVPLDTNINIIGSNGNILIAEGCGEVAVHSKNADIEILGPQGAVVAQSTNGRIRVIDAQRSTTLQTVNGNILAELLDGVLEASSTNGTIKTHVLDSRVSGCVLNTQNGGIKVVLNEGISFTVDASAERGKVQSDIAIEGAGGPRQAKSLHGSVGDGKTKLNLTTGNGNIWLARGKA